MKNILITGGAGFIGSNIALKLAAKGYNVRVLDNLSKQLHDIEISLNKIQFRGMEIGSVLSYYFDRLYQGDFDNCLIK